MHGTRKIDSENSIAWRRSLERLQKRMFTIPYFGGNKRAMPLVKLRNNRPG